MLRSVVLISLLGLCLALEVTIERRKEHLFVNGAPNGSVVQLLKLDPRASSCAESHGADVILEEHITDEGEPFSLPVDLLSPGKYCAVVVSPSGNHTSQWPAEIKADSVDAVELHSGRSAAVAQSKRLGPPNDTSSQVTMVYSATSDDSTADDGFIRVLSKKAKRRQRKAVMGNGLGSQPQCSSWNATVIIEASYTKRTVDASVNVFENSPPGCDYLRVGLWNASTQDQPCDNGNLITLVRTETEHQADSPVHLEFQNLSVGMYYCVRVRVIPECNPYGECITLMSKVIELPSAEPKGSWRRPEANQSRLLWLLLLPLLLITAAVIALSVLRARRQAWAGKPFTLPSQLPVYRKSRQNPGPPVVKVVYSRDSEPHVAAVSQLCSLLESELGMRVEWDEAAVGPAHVTHDWAMAMAQLPCPTFNPAAVKAAGRGAPEMLLVLESDGALLKHQAYRQHKDLGAVSESNIDELYHTTYAALLSNQAQALGDYCHIVVARLPYTTLHSRLDLVPENRYLLPQHLRQLLAKLLHGTSLPESRADAALSSDACRRFEDALANACNACDERGFAADSVCGKLEAILRES